MQRNNTQNAHASSIGRKEKHRRGRFSPKGRQVDKNALEEIRQLFPEAQYQRDHLIEYLHQIQDRYGCLSTDHLCALAYEMKLSQAEIFEVASFYHHFDVRAEDSLSPDTITLRVCDSLSCMLAGADGFMRALETAFEGEKNIRILPAPCMGRCDKAPVVAVGHNHIVNARLDGVKRAVIAKKITPTIPNYESYTDYKARGGYDTLDRCRSGSTTIADVLSILDQSGLRGLGGAGFPSAKKWEFVRAGSAPRYLCVNADEGEPGTFKDRYYLESHPHQFLEGLLIAAWGIDAECVYIYLRDEYPAIREILLREIEVLEKNDIIGKGFICLRRGAGAYICGEESAMIESIEGKRGLPRHRPPYVAVEGLFGRPTLVHNVETLYWIGAILKNGAQWFADLGMGDHKGLRSYSVSGRVRDPGVKCAPAGISVRALIDDYCGGMLEGHVFRAYLPGGASGGILPAHLDHLALDFGELDEYGCFVGSHAVIILSDHDNVRDVGVNLLKFFADESCGQCTPCRVGCEKAVILMEREQWDGDLLDALSRMMHDASICGLGQAAPNPIRSILRYFPQDVGITD